VLSSHTDVHTASPTDGQVLKWDNGNSRWAPSTDAVGSVTASSTTAFTNKTGALTQWTNDAGYVTAASSNTFTNKQGAISQWTNDSSYLTSVPAQSFASLTGKPTTIGGYGITDSVTATSSHAFTNKTGAISQWTNDSNYLTSVPAQTFASLTSKPTTIAGYGITDSVTASSTHTFTNKTINANGTGNSISNLEVADLASGVLDTDISSVSGSDNTLASAKAIKTYADTKLSDVVSDTTPQLGGNLDLQTHDIVTTSANEFEFKIGSGSNLTTIGMGGLSGTGYTYGGIAVQSSTNSGNDVAIMGDFNFTSGIAAGEVIGNIVLDNATGKIGIFALTTVTENSTTYVANTISSDTPNVIISNAGTSNAVTLAVGTGTSKRLVLLNGAGNSIYAFPEADGTLNQVLTTDGSGDLSWSSPTITLASLKTVVAASSDFADFKTRIAAL
jgi:hypothetical protein